MACRERNKQLSTPWMEGEPTTKLACSSSPNPVDVECCQPSDLENGGPDSFPAQLGASLIERHTDTPSQFLESNGRFGNPCCVAFKTEVFPSEYRCGGSLIQSILNY
uniref:Uncharacterized protein n=1 Tax=Oryza punctata TaxID=4537 RepID=A0A0E0JFS7_ORYPU